MLSSSADLFQVRRLEELAFAGWPALETRDVAGWRLRFSGGYTKRANSINALGQDALVDGKTLDDLETAYRERHQRPVWRLTPLAPRAMADLLSRRGHRPIERSLLQICSLQPGLATAPDVSIQPTPSAAWIDAFCTYSPVRPEHRDTMRRMLASIAPQRASPSSRRQVSRWPWRLAPCRATIWACSTCW